MNKQPVFYMQTDSKWKDKPYRTTGEDSTIGSSGCGPSCASMLIETITGKTYTPEDACNWSMKHGYKALNQGTYFSYFAAQFKEFGIDCKILNNSSVYGNANSSVHNDAFDLLKQGYYLIACMGPGTWTKGGHFVVVWWEDGKVRINDPNSTNDERSNGDLKTFKSQVKHYWAVDARTYNQQGGNVSMSTKKVVTIPLKNISKIQVYVNSNKKTLAKIKKETGADYIINGGLFNANWTACPLLKSDGKMQTEKAWSDWGYAWNTGSDVVMTNQIDKYNNFISCVSLLNPNDQTGAKLKYTSALGGKRGRTAMAIKGNSLVLYCCKDGSTNAKTPEALRDEFLEMGCESALMLDGGGSSQCDFKGDKITSLRTVHNLILVYLVGNKGSSTDEKDNNIIKTIQSTLNSRYSSGLVVDGKWGPASKKAMVKAVQTEINKLYSGKLVVDGLWGAASKKACPSIRNLTKNNLAWLIQACLLVKGFNVDLDAAYGPACANAIKQFQKNNGLGADGICGANTFTKLLT